MLVISRGTNRLVVAIPSWDVAIKFFFINSENVRLLRRFVAEAVKDGLPGLWKRHNFQEFYWGYLNRIKIGWRLTWSGLASNWRERQFYKHTNAYSRLVLQPTYFSFFGLFNIQRYGKPAEGEEGKELIIRLSAIVGVKALYDHHTPNPDNYHWAVDGIKFLDYEGKRTRDIVNRYALDLLQKFDTISLDEAKSEVARLFEEERRERERRCQEFYEKYGPGT